MKSLMRIVLSVCLLAAGCLSEGEEPLDELSAEVTLPYRYCQPGRLCFEEVPRSTWSPDAGTWTLGTNVFGQSAWLHNGNANVDVLHVPLYLTPTCSLRSAVIDYTQKNPESLVFSVRGSAHELMSTQWQASSTAVGPPFGQTLQSWVTFSTTLPPVYALAGPLGGLHIDVLAWVGKPTSVSRVVIGYSCE